MGKPTAHKARKRFGQNFLHDDAIIAAIVGAIRPQVGQHLVEIGPGLGALTFPLLKQCQSLTAIELDRDLIHHLQVKSQLYGKLRLYQGDVLKFDFATLLEGQALRVVGNLPYNISTPLLFHLLDYRQHIADMHFMVQKEVAERVTAQPGSKHWGRLGIMLQLFCETEQCFDVPPEAFDPAPKVESSIIRLRPLAEPREAGITQKGLQQVLQVSFAQRRKTLANNLKKHLSATQIEALGIDPKARPETLTMAEFATLTRHWPVTL